VSIFNNPARREKKLLRAIEKDPDNPESYLTLGKLYFLGKDYLQAVRIYEQGLKVVPANSSLLFNLGVTKEALNEIEAAKKIYLSILARDPKYQAAQERLEKITTF